MLPIPEEEVELLLGMLPPYFHKLILTTPTPCLVITTVLLRQDQKAVFHQAEFSARSDFFSSKISALNFDLISTSTLSKAKTARKRRNKMSAVKKRLALKKLLVLIALLIRRVQRQKQKIQEKILGQTDFLKNRMKIFKNLLGSGQISRHC